MGKTDQVESEKGGDDSLQAHKDRPGTPPSNTKFPCAKAKLFNPWPRFGLRTRDAFGTPMLIVWEATWFCLRPAFAPQAG
jgi:hypothetical protein